METEAQLIHRQMREYSEMVARHRRERASIRACVKCGKPVLLAERTWHPDDLPLHVRCKNTSTAGATRPRN